MTRKISWRLVIDASVTRSAHAGQKHIQQASSLAALNDALDICHRIVFTEALRKEWHRHRSNYSARWLGSMYAKKKVEVVPGPGESDSFRDQVLACAAKGKDREAMAKDFLLIEAALATDAIIISRDDAARTLFRQAASQVPRLRPLIWANPATDSCFGDWLWGRCKPSPEMAFIGEK
jgi:hypothetical protein